MTILQFRALFLWVLASVVVPTLAQTSRLFQWQFANSALATSLPTCATLPIVVKSFDPVNITHGTPPYYMIAFAVGAGGTPQTSLIGTDENNLSWTVTSPVGSHVALSVVDSNGSAGGIPPRFFQVVAGQSTQCVVTPPTDPAFTVTANVTTHLTTCQPWGLIVKGGVPPYNVTLLQLNSPVVTNVTMPGGLDQFTFIDRATPGLDLIAAISDFTGRWATGTPFVSTQGSNDTDCIGLVSSSGNSTQILQELEAANAVTRASNRRRSTVIAVVVILIFLVLGGLCFIALLYLRKQRREDQAELAEAKPRQFIQSRYKSLDDQKDSSPSEQPQPISRKEAILAEIHAARSNARAGGSSPSPTSSETTLLSSVQPHGRVGLDRSASANTTMVSSSSQSGSRASNPGFATFPTTSIRRSGKLVPVTVEVQPVLTTRSPDTENPDTGTPDSASTVDGEGVFQHQDGGVVRELPPPYAVRRSRRASS